MGTYFRASPSPSPNPNPDPKPKPNPNPNQVGTYFRERARRLEATRFEEISAGHVPQDDRPETTNRILAEWLATGI